MTGFIGPFGNGASLVLPFNSPLRLLGEVRLIWPQDEAPDFENSRVLAPEGPRENSPAVYCWGFLSAEPDGYKLDALATSR